MKRTAPGNDVGGAGASMLTGTAICLDPLLRDRHNVDPSTKSDISIRASSRERL